MLLADRPFTGLKKHERQRPFGYPLGVFASSLKSSKLLQIFFSILLVLSLFSLSAKKTEAEANHIINFQSKIVDKTTGLNVTAGSPSCVVGGADTCDFRASIYTASSGGTLLWEETHSNVELGDTGGVFNLALNQTCDNWATPGTSGDCEGGAGIDWGSDPTLYIQISFDSDGNGDFSSPETFTRKELTSVPYAYYADVAGSIDGISADGFVQLQPGSAQSATGSTALIWLNENGASTPNLLELEVGGVDHFTVSNDGFLTLVGDINMADGQAIYFNTGTWTKSIYSAANGLFIDSGDDIILTPGANDVVGIGLTAINASGAWLDIGAATTTLAQLNLTSSAGTNKTTPVSGDMWWNGTNLYFYNGSSNVDLLAASAGLFTDSGATTYLTSLTDDFAIGASSLTAPFSVDESTNTVRIGEGSGSNATLNMYASDGDTGSLSYITSDEWLYQGGNVAIAQSMAVGLTTTPSDTSIRSYFTASPLSGSAYGINSTYNYNPALPSTLNSTGFNNDVNIGGTGSITAANKAIYNSFIVQNSSTMSSNYGYDGDVRIQGGTTSSVYGINNSVQFSSTAAVTNAYALRIVESFTNSGNIGTNYGLYINATTNSGAGTISNNYGQYIGNQTAGSNDYGLYIEGADTTSLWVDSGMSRFDGNVLAGTTTNTAFLNIAAATTGQSSMRLISSAGTNPSSPNSGDLWWNGTNLNFRNASSTIDLLANASGSFVNFAPAATQSTTSTNSMINLTSTATGATNPMIIVNENGTGTPNLLQLQTASTNKFIVSNSGNVALGPTATISNDILLRIIEDFGASGSGNQLGLRSSLSNSSTSTASLTGLWSTVANGGTTAGATTHTAYYGAASNSNANFTGSIVGADLTVSSSAGSLATLYGVNSLINVQSTSSVGDVYGSYIRIQNNGSGTITDLSGIYVDNYTNAGGGTVTNGYGLYIESQTAATNDYGIYIQGADTNAIWVDSGTSRFDGDVSAYSQMNLGSLSSIQALTALRIQETHNATSGASAGIDLDITRNGTLSADTTARGIYNKLFLGVSENGFNATAYALENVATVSGALTYSQVFGVRNAAFSTSTAGSGQDQLIGSMDEAIYTSSGLVTAAYGNRGRVLSNSTGTITDAYGTQGVVFTGNASAAITNAYGVYGYIHEGSGGTITTGRALYANCDDAATCYGLYIEAGDAEVGAGADWGIYATGEDQNYLSGDLYIGSTTETIAQTGFVLDGDDQFISGMLGIEGNLYTDSDLYVRGHATFGSSGAINDGSLIDAGTTYFNIINIQEQVTDLTNYDIVSGLTTHLKLSPSGTVNSYVSGNDVFIYTDNTNAANYGNIVGMNSLVAHAGTGGASSISAFAGSANVSSNGSLTYLHGGGFSTSTTGSGTIGEMAGIVVAANNNGAGTVTKSAGLIVRQSTGGATSKYGVFIEAQSGATNNYGLYIEAASTYAIWVDSGDVRLDGNIVLPDGGSTNINDTAGNNLFQIVDTSTNFGAYMEGGAFINRNSMFAEEFNRERADVAADTALAWGDDGTWTVDEETATTADCVFATLDDTVNGIGRITATQANANCQVYNGSAVGNLSLTYDADNLPVVIMKVRPAAASANDDFWIGLADTIAATSTDPTNGIYFTNNNTGNWVGRSRSASTNSDAACGVAVSTTQFALLKIEVRSTSDVRFYVDGDVSNGISWTSCGTVSTNIPTSGLAAYIKTESTSAARVFDVDFFRTWQDDSKDSGTNNNSASDNEETIVYEINNKSTLAEEYLVEDSTIEAGDVVKLKNSSEDSMVVEKTGAAMDKGAIGVISTDPELYLSDWTTYRASARPVALVGRVPVKVTDENGAIKKGDYLTPAATPGYAMKATKGGIIIGRAMEDFVGADQGDSATVEAVLQTNQEAAEEQVDLLVASGDLTEQQADNALNQVEQTLTAEMEVPTTGEYSKGRIMMFVDQSFVSDEQMGVKSELDSAISIESFKLSSGNSLFKLNEEGEKATLTISIAKLVVPGSVVIEENLDVLGIFTADKANVNVINIQNRIKTSLGENQIADKVVIPAGKTELVIANTTITAKSAVYLTCDQFVNYRVTNVEPGVGFTIEIQSSQEVDTNFSYFIVN